MQIRLLQYGNTDNIGDTIQTLAVAQHIDQTYSFIERDELNGYTGDECVVVLNGWFSHKPQNWPPSDRIIPIFFGFHMTPEAAASYVNYKSYFKRFEPIGCRDKVTAEILNTWGVKAYHSGCATMTFPRRPVEPEGGKNILVDVSRHLLKKDADRRNSISVSHAMPPYWEILSTETKMEIANSLLELYRTKASSVITSRIHCAMPCFAMGIPTVYCGVREYRTELIDDIGLPSATLSKYWRKSIGALPLDRPHFDERKEAMADDLRSRLSVAGIKLLIWKSVT